MFNQYGSGKRTRDNFKKCYDSVDNANITFEEQPIWTYKFGEFFTYLFEEDKLNNARELLIAVLLHLLNEKGFNRHVESKMNYEEIICQNNQLIKEYKKYLNFLKTDEKDEIVSKMLEYINSSK